MQERVAWLLTRTVQAPHIFMPHPYLVPVRPRRSLITQSSGIAGLFTVTVWFCPFTLSVKVLGTIPSLLWVRLSHKQCPPDAPFWALYFRSALTYRSSTF